MGRVGSGQDVFDISLVGSGRVRRFEFSRVGSGQEVSVLTGRVGLGLPGSLVGSGRVGSGRVGSGWVRRYSASHGLGWVGSGRVGSGWVGKGGFQLSRVGSGRVTLVRPYPQAATRPVKIPGGLHTRRVHQTTRLCYLSFADARTPPKGARNPPAQAVPAVVNAVVVVKVDQHLSSKSIRQPPKQEQREKKKKKNAHAKSRSTSKSTRKSKKENDKEDKSIIGKTIPVNSKHSKRKLKHAKHAREKHARLACQSEKNERDKHAREPHQGKQGKQGQQGKQGTQGNQGQQGKQVTQGNQKASKRQARQASSSGYCNPRLFKCRRGRTDCGFTHLGRVGPRIHLLEHLL